uniref:Uncharacterized protein n=1 Tax=Oryza rufipogon TaxID=4529 RepID=A0A0E0NMB2_ORYRU
MAPLCHTIHQIQPTRRLERHIWPKIGFLELARRLAATTTKVAGSHGGVGRWQCGSRADAGTGGESPGRELVTHEVAGRRPGVAARAQPQPAKPLRVVSIAAAAVVMAPADTPRRGRDSVSVRASAMAVALAPRRKTDPVGDEKAAVGAVGSCWRASLMPVAVGAGGAPIGSGGRTTAAYKGSSGHPPPGSGGGRRLPPGSGDGSGGRLGSKILAPAVATLLPPSPPPPRRRSASLGEPGGEPGWRWRGHLLCLPAPVDEEQEGMRIQRRLGDEEIWAVDPVMSRCVGAGSGSVGVVLRSASASSTTRPAVATSWRMSSPARGRPPVNLRRDGWGWISASTAPWPTTAAALTTSLALGSSIMHGRPRGSSIE